MGRAPSVAVLAAVLACAGAPAAPEQASSPEIPSHPRHLRLEARPFNPPAAGEHRVMLGGRIPAYLGGDRGVPACKVTMLFPTGAWFDPPGKEGLAEAAASLLRVGGTERLAPDELDRELENRAIQVSALAMPDSFRVTLWCLSRVKEEALGLLAEMLRSPRFDEARLALWRRQKLQALRGIHDRVEEVLRLYWRDIIWGEDHVVGRDLTRSSITGIARDDVRAWHARWIAPRGAIIVATADMPRDDLARLLERHLGAWQPAAEAAPGWSDLPPAPPPRPPGLYLLDLATGQAGFRLGGRGIDYRDPRLPAFELVCEALGGGGFQSRLMNRIRTQEGLTYGIASHVVPGWIFPGTNIVECSAKPGSVAPAIAIALEEIRRFSRDGPTAEELEETKETMIARFAGLFDDLHDSLVGLAFLEYRGRPSDFYATYRDRIRAVALEEARRAARELFVPEEIRVLVAGDIEKIRTAPSAAGVRWEGFGPATTLTARDPLAE